MLSFITLLVLFYIYMNKYYKEEMGHFMKIMGDCFDEIHGHIEEKNEIYDETHDYDYSMWKKTD